MRLDRQSRRFYNHLLKHLERNNIKYTPRGTSSLVYNGNSSQGLFGEIDSPHYLAELEIATDLPYEDWFPVLLHESCHVDQFLESSPHWLGYYVIHDGERLDGVDIIDSWISGSNIPQDALWKATDASIAVEWDCEQRALVKIREWNLPLDPEEYAQKANAALYQYRMAVKLRRWPPEGFTPYMVPEVWMRMPRRLYQLARYRNVPKRLEAVMRKYCYPKE